MHKINLTIAHEDDRGLIQDVLEQSIDAVTFLSFNPGAIRGNHVHEETTQWTMVLKGKICAYSTDSEGLVRSAEFGEKDFFVSLPAEPHALRALEYSEVLIFTKGPRSGSNYSLDTKPFKLV